MPVAAEVLPCLDTIATRRLRLAALPRAALALLYAQPHAFARAADLEVAPGLLDDETGRAMARKLSRLQDEPEALHVWHTYWLAVTGDPAGGLALGLAGFKGPPDAAGEAEIAYSVAPAQRGQGYATEAAGALIRWAFGQTGCRAVVAPGTPRANAASIRVLEKLGFRVYASTPRAQSWRVDRDR